MSAINKINVDNVSYNIEDSRVDNIADVIPTASTEQKGLVQIGQGINVDENGVISVEASGDTVSYNPTYSGDDMAIGQIIINGVAQDIVAPRVYYMDSAAGTVELGFLIVGGDQYPITYTPAASGDSVQFNSLLASGTQIGTITINGVETAIYAPSGGGGSGSTVSYRDNTSPEDQHRVVIGELTIDGAGYYIYAPSTISVEWDNILNKPTIPTATSQLTNDSDFITAGDARDIAANQISNTSIYDLQGAPVNIGDVSGLTVTPDLSSGTKIATISWTDISGANTQDIYAPAGGSGGSVDWSDVQNKPAIEPGTPGSAYPHTANYAIQQEGNLADGDYSIAIGYDTKATNHCAVAVGGSTQASGMWAVATGDGTIASGDRQIAMGKYNSEDSNNYFAVMVGNGSYVDSVTPPNRENAEATAWNGNKYIAGDLYVNCTDWDTTTTGGQAKLVTADAGGTRVATMNDIAGLGGDTVTVTQTVTSGTKIAEIDVSGTTTSLYAPTSAADNITQDEITAWNNAIDYEEQQSVKFTSSEEFSITIAINGHPWNGELWYSDDNGNIWHPIDKTRASITITSQSGDITNNQHQLMLRGTDNTFITGTENTVSSGWNTFSLTATSGVYGSGNIMALLDYRTANTNKIITRERAFYGLFRSWTFLHTAPALPATTLSQACYAYMFTDDNAFEVAPELPATKLVTGCYASMFSGCISLKEAPALPATKLASGCYASMFYGCTGLVKVPELPATTLAANCYNRMFGNCTALKVPPVLPATELATSCYREMFTGCTSLLALPILQATVLPDYCYQQMFYGCTNITFQDSSSSEASIAYKIPDSTTAGSEGTDSLKQMFSPMYSGNISRYTTYYVSGVVRSAGYAYKPGDCMYYIKPITYIRDTVTSTGTPAPVTQLAVSRALEAYRADWNAGSGQGTILNKPNINAGTGTGAIKEGNGSTASGNYSHAEGDHATASGSYSHAEGSNTSARGSESHVEGLGSVAIGDYTHAEGLEARANGDISHAEGRYTVAESLVSHAEGDYCEARANFSHVEGSHTKAYGITSHVQGKYNIFDQNSIFADIVGNGRTVSGSTVRSNAEATDWNGNKYLSGGIYVGCTDYTTTANGLTTLGAGGFRIDQADEDSSFDPSAEVTRTDDMIMVDTVTYTPDQGSEDPDTGGYIPPTTYTTEHSRSWQSFTDLLTGLGTAPEMGAGIYTLQIWGITRYDTVGSPYIESEFRWAKTSATTPEDDPEPTPEEEPTEEEPTE